MCGEDFGARKLHRLQLNNRAWVVKKLIPITHEGDNVIPEEAFDIESILATCDDKEIRPAPRIHRDVLTDVLIPDPRFTHVRTMQLLNTRRSTHVCD